MRPDDDYCRLVATDPRGDDWDAATRAHTATCPECRAYLACVEQLNQRLQGLPLATEAMPAPLREKMLRFQATYGTIPDRSWRSRPSIGRILIPLALAASLVLGVFLQKNYEVGGVPGRTEVQGTIGMYIADVTHDHYLIERIGRPLEVRIRDAAELSHWLSSSLGFAFELPATSGNLALEGGRVWHTVGRLSAMASYRTPDGSRLILFAVPARNLELAGAQSTMVGEREVFRGQAWGHEARVWIQGDLALAVTAPNGELPADWPDVFLP